MASVPFNNLITFSRGTNATLTGPTGLIQWAPNNLLLSSEQCDAAPWGTFNATCSPNVATAPDGSFTADKFIESASVGATQGRYQDTAFTLGTYTISVYAKASERDHVQISSHSGPPGTNYAWAKFNLTTGLLVGSGVAGTAILLASSITAVGNGWYRVSLSAANVLGNIQISVATASSTTTTYGYAFYAGNGTSGIFLWGAQLELGSAATTYNSTTVKNLLGFSEAFDNAAWTKSGSSIVTGAQANPVNGAFNAQKLMENTAAGTHYALQAVSVLAAPYALSVYAKAGERSFASLAFDGLNAWFNLSTGALGTVEAGLTASIVSVGSGWYRCSVFRTVAVAGSKSCVVYPASANGVVSYTGDGNSGVYIYGAQLSDSASLDPYVPTPAAAPSSTAFYGPRFDYDPVTLAPKGILVEEARTNLQTYSQEFDNAIYGKINSTVSANVTTAPDGTTSADALTDNATVGGHSLSVSTVVPATTHTLTVYAKANSITSIMLYSFTASGGVGFNLSNGTTFTVTGAPLLASYSITPAGNGWYRCAIQFTGTGTATPQFGIYTVVGGAFSYSGTGQSAFLWGIQVEAGAFATSYIPTVASTVTRAADVATINGSLFSQWYTQPQGTIVSVFSSFATGSSSRVVAELNNGTTDNRYTQVHNPAGSDRFLTFSGGSAVVTTLDYTAVGVNVIGKWAGAYAAGNYGASLNGATALTSTYGFLPSGINLLAIGSSAGGAALNGHIQSIQYYPVRAADFQLQQVTT
jgi:hypothetical protein